MCHRAMKVLVGLALALALDGCGGAADSPANVIAFDVTVPAGTSGTVYVTGDVAELGGWSPGGALALVNQGSGRWTRTVEVGPAVTSVAYKYTRGDWTTVEKLAGCVEAMNRVVAVAGAVTAVTDTVAGWSDWCN